MIEDIYFILNSFLIISCIFTCGIFAYWIVLNLKLQRIAKRDYDFEIPLLRCVLVCMLQPIYYIPIINMARFLYLIISDYDEKYLEETLETIKNLD